MQHRHDCRCMGLHWDMGGNAVRMSFEQRKCVYWECISLLMLSAQVVLGGSPVQPRSTSALPLQVTQGAYQLWRMHHISITALGLTCSLGQLLCL
jgi:hypothetical protein